MSKILDDRRTIRTKKMIRNALSELIEEKGFNNISITELTTRADINRGTFYLHYTDKYDLWQKIEDEVIQELQDHTKNAGLIDLLNVDYINKPTPFLTKIFEYLNENRSFMKAMLGPKGNPVFQNKLKRFIETYLFEKVLSKKHDGMLIPKVYFISYVLSAHLGVIQQWLESGMAISPEEITLILSRMFVLGPLQVAGLKRATDPEGYE